MTKTTLPALVITVSVLLSAVAQTQAEITGAWDVTFDSPQGPATIEVTFTQVGESVDGTIATPLGAFNFTGALINNSLSLSAAPQAQGNKLDLQMKAKVSGDTMTGHLALGGLGEIPWTAKRKPVSPPGSPTPAASEAAVGDVSGKWDIEISMAGVAFSTIATLKQVGEQITGTIGGQAGEEPVTGTIAGKAVTLRFRAATSQGDAAIAMTGDLGADGLRGRVTIPGMGELDWKGTRAK